PPPVPPRRRR
nr:Chain B, SOS PEPTIDE (PRO-PRO-PRO-VAL-PRO-PRO-ARG-ARG-ARG-ARG) [Homo sapiens]